MNGTAAAVSPQPVPFNAAAQVAKIAYCYVLPTVCVLGITGNITNLMVLASRRLRAVSYMYLRALAVADLLCMLFVLIFVSLEILDEAGYQMVSYPAYRFYRVHLMLTLINWALGTGVFVVVALSLERYISIVFPMHFRTWNSPQRAYKAIALSYIIPFLLYLPYGAARYRVIEIDGKDNSTTYSIGDSEVAKTVEWAIYKWSRETALRFGPIVVLCILNVQIMLAFRKRQKMFTKMTKRKEQTAKDDTLLYMLGGTVIMFFICNIPAAINLLFINESLKKRMDFQVFRAVANILEIANHASQFYVFCACSTDYRTTFLLKFPCFEKNYANRGTLRSIVKRTQSMMTRDRASSSDENRNNSPKSAPQSSSGPQIRIVDTDTIDVQLVSCEDIDRDGDRESDILLRHNLITTASTNGSTFL